jgi:hypothetical protein
MERVNKINSDYDARPFVSPSIVSCPEWANRNDNSLVQTGFDANTRSVAALVYIHAQRRHTG